MHSAVSTRDLVASKVGICDLDVGILNLRPSRTQTACAIDHGDVLEGDLAQRNEIGLNQVGVRTAIDS